MVRLLSARLAEPQISRCTTLTQVPFTRHRLLTTAVTLLALLTGCRRHSFPDVPPNYREFAYVANAGANTVSVLDLVYLRPDHTLKVGDTPMALATNPVRNEIYVVNRGSASISVIDALRNQIAATIAVRRQPSAIAIAADGRRAFVANSGANSVSILDLDARRELSTVPAGNTPMALALSPDARSLVVASRASATVSIFSVAPTSPATSGAPLTLRVTIAGCPGAAAVTILPDSSKAFVACAAARRVMAISLAAAPNSWPARQNASLLTDHLLTLLDVGANPNALALKPDGGEVFVSNSDSDSISEIATWPNEVGGTYTIASHPAQLLASADNGSLWIANEAADTVGIYSIDDGRLTGSVRTGSAPVALAFSADEHLLLAANANSGDVAIIRTDSKQGPALFTMLPAGTRPSALVTKSFTSKR